MIRRVILVLVVCSFAVSAQMRTDTSITGQNAPKGVYALSFDDGPDDINPTGRSETEQIAELLGNGTSRFGKIPATFFMVACHFASSGVAPDSKSSLCKSSGTVSMDLIDKVRQFGHEIGNHSAHHLSYPGLNKSQTWSETDVTQAILAPYQSARHMFRFPGFSTSTAITAEINTHPATANLNGPYAADFNGAGTINGIYLAGDYDCFTHLFDPATCGDLYVQQMAAADHGGIILIHDRPQGSVGSQYSYKMLDHILKALPAETQFVPIWRLAEYQAGAMPNTPMQLTKEFGADDGYGDVQFGDVNNSGKQAACKSRADGVWCALSDSLRLVPPKLWLAVERMTTRAGGVTRTEFTPGQRIWLMDMDGDGKADLVWEGPLGVYVSISTGSRFKLPDLWLRRNAAGGYRNVAGSANYAIMFGDFNGDGLPDLLFWSSAGLVVATSTGADFDTPAIWSKDFKTGWSPDQQSMLAGDINHDGVADVCARLWDGVHCAISDGGQFGQSVLWAGAGQFDAMNYQFFGLADVVGSGVRSLLGMKEGSLLFSQSDGTRFLTPRSFNLTPAPDWGSGFTGGPSGFANWSGTGKDTPYWMAATGIYGSFTQGLR